MVEIITVIYYFILEIFSDNFNFSEQYKKLPGEANSGNFIFLKYYFNFTLAVFQ